MMWTELHASLLSRAFEKVLARPEVGSVAYVRCLTPDVVAALAAAPSFSPKDWRVYRVADASQPASRSITADQAVELREAKREAVLLLVDTSRAGAGMDGIYSAARQIDEAGLFAEALRLARREVESHMGRPVRAYAERAIEKAQGFGRLCSISPWSQFQFLVQIVNERRHPGELVWLLGLWPIKQQGNGMSEREGLDVSRLMVERLLGPASAGQSPTQRIEALRLVDPSGQQKIELERFLHFAATRPLLPALAALADKPQLWVNALQFEGTGQTIQAIAIIPWRTRAGRLVKWSGLTEVPEEPLPVLTLDPQAELNGNYSSVEVRWRAVPETLAKDAAQYHVALVTDMQDELVSREVSHAERREQKCRFTNDDFSLSSERALLSAKVVISVVGNEAVETQESEEFLIRFGTPPERPTGGVGRVMRSFSEGLIELEDREAVSNVLSETPLFTQDARGYVSLRVPGFGKSYRVFRPPLIKEIEEDWFRRNGEVGRWRVRVRTSGARAGSPEFVSMSPPPNLAAPLWQSVWERVAISSRRMALDRFATVGGGVAQVYDQNGRTFDSIVKEYLLAWAALLEQADPQCALANTVEIQSLSGRTIGLIVLPAHPLRVAWHVAYDNLVLHARFAEAQTPKRVREEFALLDGAMFPAFLPGTEPGKSFVFADTLGFHAVGMVPDDDREPKAAVAILARALGESDSGETAPTVGRESAQVLGDEICKYIECHHTARVVHIHALRPGDGLTMARALGHVYRRSGRGGEMEDFEPAEQTPGLSFVLELYPSERQRGMAGRFIVEAREKRRSGAGIVSEEDRWMLQSESLPGGTVLPRLRWARKREKVPTVPAHLAVAFDTFDSHVEPEPIPSGGRRRPYFAFGLISFFERQYTSVPSPMWRSALLHAAEGEKHPADRTHTERLMRLQQIVQDCVARSLGKERAIPTLRTEITPEKADELRKLHRLCDWVITLDRNAGIEYFDSPRDHREIYDAYVIDCVPEREDLGCLQLITSTSNLEEVRALLDRALDQMGLSRSRRNAEFLLEHLKALSGRLAIRLTGQKAATAELIALALFHAHCWQASEEDQDWMSLRRGFFVPIDDVRDLLPPLDPRRHGASLPLPDVASQQHLGMRPDLIYVTYAGRKGLLFRLIEVKYRRHLRTARSLDGLDALRQQVESLRSRWDEWYGDSDVPATFRAVRRAKLARVLRFYADKARRHADDEACKGLGEEAYRELTAEIDKMVERGTEYAFGAGEATDLGWIFCPEYAGARPLQIAAPGWDTRIFLFGPGPWFRGVAPQAAQLSSGPAGAPLESLKREGAEASVLPPAEAPAGGEEHCGRAAQPVPIEVAGEQSPATEAGPAGMAGQQAAAATPSICVGTSVHRGGEVRWPLSVRGNPHLLLAGLPGMGKTTCILNLCGQMVGLGIQPIVFSYHEDIDAKLQRIVERVRFIDFDGLGFNPLQVLDRRQRKAHLDVAGAVRDIFMAIFPELGDIQGERIRRAIKESFGERGWDDPCEDPVQMVEPEFGRFVEILRSDPKPDRGLRALLARLDELEDYGFFRAAATQESLWQSEIPVVLRIHATQNDNLQKAFAALVFYGLYKDMFRRGIQERITHAIVFDEAHRAARLQLIPTMAKECRKYGISLVLASQEARDFHVSVFSAIANYLVLRLTEADARALAKNVATSDQERALIDRIKQLERFQAFYCSESERKPVLVALLPEAPRPGSASDARFVRETA